MKIDSLFDSKNRFIILIFLFFLFYILIGKIVVLNDELESVRSQNYYLESDIDDMSDLLEYDKYYYEDRIEELEWQVYELELQIEDLELQLLDSYYYNY